MAIKTEAEMLARFNGYLAYLDTLEEDSINRKLKFQLEEYSFEDRTVTLSFPTEKWMLNPGGVVHGGLVSTMFDISMGCSSAAFSGCYPPTVTLSVAFLCPVPDNDRILVNCRATKVGGRFVQMNAQAVIKSSGEVCATASGTFYNSSQKVI